MFVPGGGCLPRGSVCQGGVCAGGWMSAQGGARGCVPGGVCGPGCAGGCLPRGVCAKGCLSRRVCVCQGVCVTDIPRGQTDTCENITFANFLCGR